MIIRRAQKKDIPGMLQLLLQVGQVHYDIRPDLFQRHTLKYDEAALEVLVLQEDKPIFVAVDGEFVSGYCFCVHRNYRNNSVLADHKELYIDDLCVDEKHRGQGIARALYRHVQTYAKDCGCSHVTLNVWCGNDNAMAFYEKMGLRPRSIMMEQALEDEEC
jgi:ribosomal protein S18 acetylase RimI-like enzyme